MHYHFCTNGLLKSLIFSSDEDYIYGMNSIALCKLKFPDVRILAFCLMDNHVHFIFECAEDEGAAWMRHYKLLIGNYVMRRYGSERSLKGADIGCKAMPDAEYCVRAIAYVLRNPLSAGVQVLPAEYRWSSACLYFGSRVFCQSDMRRAGDIGRAMMKSLTRSHCAFPAEWHVDGHGMVFPGDYTDYKEVERIFGRPSQLLYYIIRNNDASIEADTGILAKCRYSDAELCASRDEIIRNVLKKSGLNQLSVEDKISLASIMRRRYHVSAPSLARVIGIDRQLVRQMM